MISPHCNEFVSANGLGGRSPGYNDNSVNVHSQTEFRTRHTCPRENVPQKQSRKSIKNQK